MATSKIQLPKGKEYVVDNFRCEFTLNNEANKETNFALSKSGYTPIGITGWNVVTSADFYLLRCYVSGSTLYAYLTNKRGATYTGTINVDVKVLYQEN